MTPELNRITQGDVLALLPTLADESVQCCVTSPPYWGLRRYGHDGEWGAEATPEAFVEHMREFAAALWPKLRGDGILFLNLGDSYANDTKWGGKSGGKNYTSDTGGMQRERRCTGLKAKDLVGIPWRTAFALQADGWYLRSDILWEKVNPMPESVTDRPTRAHEYIFMLTKNARYFYDAEAVKEAAVHEGHIVKKSAPGAKNLSTGNPTAAGFSNHDTVVRGRNLRSVWTIPTCGYPGSHSATFPPELARRCILAGTSAKGACPKCGAGWVREANAGHTTTTGWRPSCTCGTEHPIPQVALDADPSLIDDFEIEPFPSVPCLVLDPFAGSGTTGVEAILYGQAFIGFDLAGGDCDHGGFTPNDRLRAAEQGRRLDMRYLKANAGKESLFTEGDK